MLFPVFVLPVKLTTRMSLDSIEELGCAPLPTFSLITLMTPLGEVCSFGEELAKQKVGLSRIAGQLDHGRDACSKSGRQANER